MKKGILLMLGLCFLLAGCSAAAVQPETEPIKEETETPEAQAEPAMVIYPLPDSTMADMNDAILPVSMEADGVYADNAGKIQMDVTIYSYDKYDLVDISLLEAGAVLVTGVGEVKVDSLVRNEDGSISINGDAMVLVTDDCGIYYEQGLNGEKNWHEIGAATLCVSENFKYCEHSDSEQVYDSGCFLNGEVTDYAFTPDNTTIRVESGMVVEMQRTF